MVKALTAAKARAVALNDNAYYTLRKKEIELLRLKCINWASDYNSRFHKNCKNTKLELTPFILDFCSMIFLTVILRKTLKIYLILVIFFGLFTVVVNIYTITELSINFVNQDNFQSQGYIDSAKTCQYFFNDDVTFIFQYKDFNSMKDKHSIPKSCTLITIMIIMTIPLMVHTEYAAYNYYKHYATWLKSIGGI